MTTNGSRASRLPRDVHARERLRMAQQQEAGALAEVCTAQRGLEAACARRDAAVVAADERVEQAQTVLAQAQAKLVQVSGIDRAAGLLSIRRTELRRTITSVRDVQSRGRAR